MCTESDSTTLGTSTGTTGTSRRRCETWSRRVGAERRSACEHRAFLQHENFSDGPSARLSERHLYSLAITDPDCKPRHRNLRNAISGLQVPPATLRLTGRLTAASLLPRPSRRSRRNLAGSILACALHSSTIPTPIQRTCSKASDLVRSILKCIGHADQGPFRKGDIQQGSSCP